jgi:hypothetical protein
MGKVVPPHNNNGVGKLHAGVVEGTEEGNVVRVRIRRWVLHTFYVEE